MKYSIKRFGSEIIEIQYILWQEFLKAVITEFYTSPTKCSSNMQNNKLTIKWENIRRVFITFILSKLY